MIEAIKHPAPDTIEEAIAVSSLALNNIRHLTHTLQNYIWEGDVSLKPENETVINALLDRIITECD